MRLTTAPIGIPSQIVWSLQPGNNPPVTSASTRHISPALGDPGYCVHPLQRWRSMCIFVANTRPVRTTITGESLQRPLTTQPPRLQHRRCDWFSSHTFRYFGCLHVGFQRLLDIGLVSLPNPTADLMIP